MLGRNWDGFTTKLRLRCDAQGRICALALTSGQADDLPLDVSFQPCSSADLTRLQQLVEMVLHRCNDRYYARQQRVYEGQRLQTAPLTANHHAVELAETNEQGEVVASFA